MLDEANATRYAVAGIHTCYRLEGWRLFPLTVASSKNAKHTVVHISKSPELAPTRINFSSSLLEST